MVKNMTLLDRSLRTILALVLFYLAFSGVLAYPWNWVAGIIGTLNLFFSSLGYCPAYPLFRRR